MNILIPTMTPQGIFDLIKVLPRTYLEDKCSLGRAAELAGVMRWEIMEELSARGVPTNGGHEFSAPEIETMLQVMEERYGYRDGYQHT